MAGPADGVNETDVASRVLLHGWSGGWMDASTQAQLRLLLGKVVSSCVDLRARPPLLSCVLCTNVEVPYADQHVVRGDSGQGAARHKRRRTANFPVQCFPLALGLHVSQVLLVQLLAPRQRLPILDPTLLVETPVTLDAVGLHELLLYDKKLPVMHVHINKLARLVDEAGGLQMGAHCWALPQMVEVHIVKGIVLGNRCCLQSAIEALLA